MTVEEAYQTKEAAEKELEAAKMQWDCLEDEMKGLRNLIEQARWNYERKRTNLKQAEERLFYTLYPNERPNR